MPPVVRAIYAGGADEAVLLDPGGSVWRDARKQPLALKGAPAGLQPTAAIRTAWAGRRIGAIGQVDISAAHNGAMLAFRLDWIDPGEDRQMRDATAFADAAAVLLPGAATAPLMTMGKPGAPVNAWYWRADEEGAGRHTIAEGLGTTRTLDTELVRTRSIRAGGRWQGVIARALRAREEAVVQLAPGHDTRFGVAVWQGSAAERAGIKAFSGDWLPIQLAPVRESRS